LRPVPWIVATALGMGVGLLLGATVVGFRTSLTDVAVMGALTGVVLGLAQTVALPARTRQRWWWAAAMPLLWGLGWIVHHPGRDSHGRTVHHLRRQRRRHLLRPVRPAAVPATAPHANGRDHHRGRRKPDPGAG